MTPRDRWELGIYIALGMVTAALTLPDVPRWGIDVLAVLNGGLVAAKAALHVEKGKGGAKISGVVVRLVMPKNLKVNAVWTNPDGSTFEGFDDTHPQPADWNVSETGDGVTATGPDTFTVDSASDETITFTYGAFSTTYDFVAAKPQMAGLKVEEA